MIFERKVLKQITETLSEVLANTYVLYVKTQNFHWNIIDPRFYSLHLLLEKQYEDLAEGADEIAERIRGLGELSPGSLKEFLQLTSLKEARNDLSGNQMLQQLYDDHVAVAKQLRGNVDRFTAFGDHGSADLLIERLRVHEKAAWMLVSHLSESKNKK